MTGSKGVVLQARDVQLLRELAHLRVVDREHAKALAPFGSTTRANTRLLQLLRGGLLTRLPYGSRLGGQRYVYALTVQGARAAGTDYQPPLWDPHGTLAWSPTLEHQLALNRVYLLLKQPPVPYDRIRLVRWRTFAQPISSATRLKPDAYAEVETAEALRGVFLEVDRGTESLKVWRGKIKSYLAFAISGEFTRTFRHTQFRVAVLTVSRRRTASLRRMAANHTDKLFWFSELDTSPDHFFGQSWSRPTGDVDQFLI